jgi:hypothetical protein
MNNAQLLTLKAAIAAETDPTFVADRTAGAVGRMADFYNANHPTAVVWRSSLTADQIWAAVVWTDVIAMTVGNRDALKLITQHAAIRPTDANIRAAFSAIFGASASLTNLVALAKRPATRAEALMGYSAGAGTDATPGVLNFEGAINGDHIVRAL